MITPALSQFRLSLLSLPLRVPFWAQAAACALFAVVGVLIMDDYRMQGGTQREIAIANADYIATGDISELSQAEDIAYRYYGMAFETPLLLVERALGLQDSRHIYLTRHLLTHLFFIVGGFACGMLAYRMLGNRWIALLATLMFLLHPRLYAQSFFNTKDIPFAAMLLIALYLAHRAFRKDTLGAFLLCGIGVGFAINLRPFGLMLLPLMIAVRAPDLWQAGRGERKRILARAGAFAGAALAVVYIIHPYYWENPLRFIDGLRAMAQHPYIEHNLFMGELYPSDAAPWNYIPVWFAITAPPLTLLPGAIGCGAACWQAISRPLAALRDREIRFRIMLLGCFALPVVVAIALQANIYSGWRQMYFLWGPFCLLAVAGLRAVASGGAAKDAAAGFAARLPGWVRGGAIRRGLAYGVVCVGLATTLTAMAALHPHQQVYFNALVDTRTPGALAERYEMDYGSLAQRQLLEYLLARYPEGALRVWPKNPPTQILPRNDRDRLISFENPHAADFYLLRDPRGHPLFREPPLFRENSRDYYLHPLIDVQGIPDMPALYTVRAYGGRVAYIVARDVDAYRAAYDDVAASGTLIARSAFDVYAYDGALYYLSANCAPPMSNDADIPIFLHIFPADPDDLATDIRERGFENRDFGLAGRAAFFDGKCIHRQPLPDYPIARIRTGHNAAARGGAEWRVDANIAGHAAAQALYESVAAGDYGLPAAQSGFDVYMRGNALIYLKENCAAGDAEARFFLHIFPADPADLPADGSEAGFENRDFRFGERGAYAGDKCVAERELPSYAIERIRTGQFVSGGGQVWGVEFAAER